MGQYFLRSLLRSHLVSIGVRQGSVLSPISFALYIDDIGKSCFIDIILYADDIILIAPSVTELEKNAT